MLDNAITTIMKKDRMNIGSKSWREGIKSKTTNIASVFRVAGLLHLYFPEIQHHLKF